MTKPFVASFDVATSTGVCAGRPGDRHPYVTTWDLRTAGPSRPRRLAYLSFLCDQFFRENKIDVLRFEAPMPLAVMSKMGATEETLLLLRGAIGVLESRAAIFNIADIGSFAVQDARKHLTGRRTFPRRADGKSDAKRAVMDMARTLGVEVKNDNESDAYAGWSLTCALLNPRIAHLVTPLFQETA